jgi:RNA polymerase sigma factor (sigma-70 family)
MLQPDQNAGLGDAVHPETLTVLIQVIESRRNKLVRSAQRITGNRGDAQMNTWLHSIVTNSAISKLRSRRGRCNVSLETGLQSAESLLISTSYSEENSPEQPCAKDELHTILHGEIEQLKPTYRSAVQLYDIDERSYGNVAKFLNLSISKVKSRLFRGRKLLRQRVHQQVFTRSPQAPC